MTEALARAVEATIGLGSNIGDKAANIDRAITLLMGDGDVRVEARSRLYRSAPWGVTDQDWFVNAAVRVSTALSPRALLERCQNVEREMGRVRIRRWGERVIDVDILTYGDRKIAEPDLKVPHPLIGERAFVLVPLIEVAPRLSLDGKTLEALLSRLDARDVVPFDP